MRYDLQVQQVLYFSYLMLYLMLYLLLAHSLLCALLEWWLVALEVKQDVDV